MMYDFLEIKTDIQSFNYSLIYSFTNLFIH